jgi:hypothetical protein
MIREELQRFWTWEERHRRLVARLVLLFLLPTAVIDGVGTLAMYHLEQNASGTQIHSLYDSWFFTTTQLLTVSSQIQNPVTDAGRLVDVFLELWAVFAIGGAGGAFASFFMTSDKG